MLLAAEPPNIASSLQAAFSVLPGLVQSPSVVPELLSLSAANPLAVDRPPLTSPQFSLTILESLQHLMGVVLGPQGLL